MTDAVKPAFYALRRGGWRDYVTLLHLPYTAWNLSYVATGCALAPHFHTNRMLWTLAAFFLALGISAHALDELNGRPLKTEIPTPVLVTLATVSLAGAAAIGIVAAHAWGWGLLAFVGVGAVLVPAYNLEWFGGLLHNELGLGLAWGAFPILTGYFVEAQTIRFEAVFAAAYGAALVMAQRNLSTPVRAARRQQGTTEGIAPLERALRLLTIAAIALAVALVVSRLT
ncbi:MAG TPA: hypothetical protein VGL84_07085 [Gaiellaceae bacterium]|jgi:hypothetical protein